VAVPLAPRLAHLVEIWKSAIDPWRRRAIAAVWVASLLAGAHLARLGSRSARLSVAAVLATIVVGAAGAAIGRRLSWRRPRSLARATIGRLDRDLADRTARAVTLVQRSDQEANTLSRGLARLHLEGVLGTIGTERLAECADRIAQRWRWIGTLAGCTAIGALLIGPLRVVEGLDVLAARNGRGPVPLAYVGDLLAEVQVPRYLRRDDIRFFGYGPVSLPRGSAVTLHAVAVHPDRRLVLTDGKQQVPFVDDAHGAVSARWTLADSVVLEIAARFGDVLIVQHERMELVSIADQAPQVMVEGAPSEARLFDVQEIAVQYQATDDHGLTEIDLVLRAGEREDRRVLARLDGQSMYERGSAIVRATDRFIRGSHLPVEVSVEARDNDPITGPKWGRSPALTLVPPSIGEAEAQRYAAIKAIVDVAVDQLATRLTFEALGDGDECKRHASGEAADHARLMQMLQDANGRSFAGLKMPRWLAAAAAGRLERVGWAIAQEQACRAAQDLPRAHDRARVATEQAVLTLDQRLRVLASVDSIRAARKLADVAQEAAFGSQLARTQDRARGVARLQASLGVLDGSARWIGKLDRVGKDLGGVVESGVRRIRRCADASDLQHAELAAEDLAARLRASAASFSGGGGSRSTEAAAGDPSGQGQEQADSAAELDQERNELDDIAREHADQMKRLEEDLSRADESMQLGSLRQAAREHARLVREAVANLPSVSPDPSSAEAAAVAAREAAESMADALDQVNLPEAVSRGRSAVRSAQQAQRLSGQQRDFFGQPIHLAEPIEPSRAKLEREIGWAQQLLEQQRRAASDKARPDIERAAGAEQQLARRTDQLGHKGRGGDAPLPKAMLGLLDEAAQSMHEASRALRDTQLQPAAERQRQAQRLLEMAREIQGSRDSDEPPSGSETTEQQGNSGSLSGGPVDIPRAEQFHGPDSFRRRVLEGLGGSRDPHLKNAVRRYAEGLLR
jgi:hypothetical protein